MGASIQNGRGVLQPTQAGQEIGPVSVASPASSGGMLGVKSNAQLDAEELAKLEAGEAANRPVMVGLAAYVRKAFAAAEMHKAVNVTPRLLNCERRVKGEYDPERLALIRARGGSETYFNETATKAEALKAYLEDIISSGGGAPFTLAPSPIPELPEEDRKRIVDITTGTYSARAAEMGATGPDDRAAFLAEVKRFAMETADNLLKQLFQEAKKRCEKHQRLIEDQLAEGGWDEALAEFLEYFTALPTAVMTCERRAVQRLKWDPATDQAVVEDREVWAFRAVDPMLLFMSPTAKTTSEGYICELVYYNPRELGRMRGRQGWKASVIDAVLADAETSSAPKAQAIVGMSEHERLNDRNPVTAGPDGNIEAVLYHGLVQWRDLLDWYGAGSVHAHSTSSGQASTPSARTDGGETARTDGAELLELIRAAGEPNPTDFIDARVVLCGPYVLYAVLNPDPLGARPYFASSARKKAGSFWGTAIPELMADIQDVVNACNLALVNNMALASGPMGWLDCDAIAPGQTIGIRPWTLLQFHGNKVPGTRDPMKFFQPSTNSAELMGVSESFARKADDRTMVPRFTYGNAEVGGAGETASGLSMLREDNRRGVKSAVRRLDTDIITPVVRMFYTYNLLYNADPSIRADAYVVPKGVLSILRKEQTEIRRQEFWKAIDGSQLAQQVIGVKGYSNLLREIAKGLDMNEDDLVPPKEEIEVRAREMMQAQFAEGMGMAEGAAA